MLFKRFCTTYFLVLYHVHKWMFQSFEMQRFDVRRLGIDVIRSTLTSRKQRLHATSLPDVHALFWRQVIQRLLTLLSVFSLPVLHSSLPGLEDFRRERGDPERRCVIDAASGVDLDRNDSSPATLLRINDDDTHTHCSLTCSTKKKWHSRRQQ